MSHGSDAAPFVYVEATAPFEFCGHLLDHEGVDIDKRELDQMETEHSDLLIVNPDGGLAALTE